jgi:hypothetical protein
VAGDSGLLPDIRRGTGRFSFELRGFALTEERLLFYIKPSDGLQFPAIMQWLKQIFSVRFNRRTGRTGHVWGDRYWSRVLEGSRRSGRRKWIGKRWM